MAATSEPDSDRLEATIGVDVLAVPDLLPLRRTDHEHRRTHPGHTPPRPHLHDRCLQHHVRRPPAARTLPNRRIPVHLQPHADRRAVSRQPLHRPSPKTRHLQTSRDPHPRDNNQHPDDRPAHARPRPRQPRLLPPNRVGPSPSRLFSAERPSGAIGRLLAWNTWRRIRPSAQATVSATAAVIGRRAGAVRRAEPPRASPRRPAPTTARQAAHHLIRSGRDSTARPARQADRGPAARSGRRGSGRAAGGSASLRRRQATQLARARRSSGSGDSSGRAARGRRMVVGGEPVGEGVCGERVGAGIGGMPVGGGVVGGVPRWRRGRSGCAVVRRGSADGRLGVWVVGSGGVRCGHGV